MDHCDLFAKLAAAWAAEGHEHARPATDDDIAAFESRYAVRLPSDLRTYFATVNGGALGHDGSMDHEMISFWRLDQVRSQLELNEGKGGRDDLFGFAEWSIDCHTYEIQLHGDPGLETPIVIDYGSELQKVAGSFSEFIAAYLRCDDAVLYGVNRSRSGSEAGPSA